MYPRRVFNKLEYALAANTEDDSHLNVNGRDFPTHLVEHILNRANRISLGVHPSLKPTLVEVIIAESRGEYPDMPDYANTMQEHGVASDSAVRWRDVEKYRKANRDTNTDLPDF